MNVLALKPLALRTLIVLVAVALAIPHSALAVITFTQLDQDTFVVSHRVKIIGSRGKAQKMVYIKASSLCLAAEYSHFKILDQESNASQQYESANASIRVQFFHEDGEGRIDCENQAEAEYIEQALNKLDKIGYVPEPPPEPGEAPAAAAAEGGTKTCTVDQITAMVRAGLTDEQIKAACPDDAP